MATIVGFNTDTNTSLIVRTDEPVGGDNAIRLLLIKAWITDEIPADGTAAKIRESFLHDLENLPFGMLVEMYDCSKVFVTAIFNENVKDISESETVQ